MAALERAGRVRRVPPKWLVQLGFLEHERRLENIITRRKEVALVASIVSLKPAEMSDAEFIRRRYRFYALLLARLAPKVEEQKAMLRALLPGGADSFFASV